jgi:hypothetical protein
MTMSRSTEDDGGAAVSWTLREGRVDPDSPRARDTAMGTISNPPNRTSPIRFINQLLGAACTSVTLFAGEIRTLRLLVIECSFIRSSFTRAIAWVNAFEAVLLRPVLRLCVRWLNDTRSWCLGAIRGCGSRRRPESSATFCVRLR